MNLREALAFDDVLLVPSFSSLDSRKDVDLSSSIFNSRLKLPIISSPMDTVTSPAMCKALHKAGALGCLHRFQNPDSQLKEYKEADCNPMVAIGLNDFERLELLLINGADNVLLDLAHGAQSQVADYVDEIRKRFGNEFQLTVGNFAAPLQIIKFNELLKSSTKINAYRCGVGGGSACITRLKTGHGLPTLESIVQCAEYFAFSDIKIIADGGLKTPGDIAKALAAGADAVMLGGMLAGTNETPGPLLSSWGKAPTTLYESPLYKRYRGSASKESYEAQNKNTDWITAEGESFLVPYRGKVEDVLKDIEGGLRSAFTYTGASNLEEFQRMAQFVKVTQAGHRESTAHGKKE